MCSRAKRYERGMKKGKKVGIVVGILVIVAAVCAVGVFASMQYKKIDSDSDNLIQELAALEEAEMAYIDSDEDDTDNRAKLDKILDRTVCETKQCATLESGAKSYVRDVLTCMDDYIELYDDERLVNVLSPENIASDGPDFEESIAYLKDMRKKFDNIHARVQNLLTDDMLRSYMHMDDMDPITRYLMQDQLDSTFDSLATSEWDELKESNDAYIDDCLKALELLADEPENWSVKGGNVEIYDDDLYDAYVDAVNSATSSMSSVS